jgi:hypothetical protein
MASFASAPDNWRPAGQRLIFSLTTSTTITAAFRYIIQVFENGTEIGKYYLAPNDADKAHFDLSLVRNRVQLDNIASGGTTPLFSYTTLPLTKATTGVKKYEVKVGEWSGTTETLAQATSTIYLLDGAEQPSQGLHPSYADYYGTASTKKFWLMDRALTGSTINLYADDTDEGMAAFINTSVVSDVTSLVYTVQYASSTSSVEVEITSGNGGQAPSATPGSNVAGTLLYAALMPVNVEAITGLSLSGWVSYSITPAVYTVAGLKGRAIKVIKRCTKYNVQVAFQNSRGGWDYLKFEGRPATQTSTEEKTFTRYLGDYDAATFSYIAHTPQTVPFMKSAEVVYTLNSVMDATEFALMAQLVKSKQVFIRYGSWIPVTIQTNSVNIRATASDLNQVSFQVKLAQMVEL